MCKTILAVGHLCVRNKDSRAPREFAIEDLSFIITSPTSVLIVGGAAAGKTSLMGALDLNNSSTFCGEAVTYSAGVVPQVATKSEHLPEGLDTDSVILKDGFQLENCDHWLMLRKIKSANATLIATTEIHRLEDWRPEFDRVILLSEGKVVADGEPSVVKAKVDAEDYRGFLEADEKVLRSWIP